MATTEEVYDSICEVIQGLIERIESVEMTEEQLNNILKRIGNLNAHLEEYAQQIKR